GVARGLTRRMAGGWLGGRARGEAFTALVRALEMNRESVDETLRALDVHELRCEGEAFDPESMRAVEAAGPEEGAPGTVVATRRPGWMEGGRIYRPAEVRAVPARTAEEEDAG
ncbi:MAG: nucleotide exchange factor GrpE, partial [Planctomycetota bacterium]